MLNVYRRSWRNAETRSTTALDLIGIKQTFRRTGIWHQVTPEEAEDVFFHDLWYFGVMFATQRAKRGIALWGKPVRAGTFLSLSRSGAS